MNAPASTGEHGQEHEPVFLAEDVPTGLFGRSAYRLPAHITPWTVAEQAAHLAELTEAVSQAVPSVQRALEVAA